MEEKPPQNENEKAGDAVATTPSNADDSAAISQDNKSGSSKVSEPPSQAAATYQGHFDADPLDLRVFCDRDHETYIHMATKLHKGI
jgi:hypothetical protein